MAYAYVNGGSYRPGDSVNLSGELHYHGFESWTPELQIDARSVMVDSGTQADTFSTGGTLFYLTPGVRFDVSERLRLRASLQLPVYQNLNGIQLTPTGIFSVGAHFSF